MANPKKFVYVMVKQHIGETPSIDTDIQVFATSNTLEDYIKEHYPEYKFCEILGYMNDLWKFTKIKNDDSPLDWIETYRKEVITK